ncbi:ABC transporter permease [Bacillus sp. AFS041924]|uniref:ABC transporter permease n=1 Tax=Bacillus sp. AFS041924 TaxID=2033503 RepID=UPI000BFD7162|nr:ABC transporter permease [Bacillus sp. AFS041924]PGS47141.1 sugar ABC transporter permease [Bacillus sp. AFS041924]
MKKGGIISLIAIFLGLIAGALLILITGNDPVEGFSYLFQGGLKDPERIGNTLATATPLILTGLSVAFAFRTGLFNIGASGQMLFGGFVASAIGLTYDLPTLILVPIMVIAGALAGALWAFIPGLLKAKFNVHEVVSTIMMNWIAYWTIYYLVPQYFKGNTETESKILPDAATLKMQFLTDLFGGSWINFGLFIAVIMVIIISFIINRTVLGYELKAVGYNRSAAEYAGISVNRNVILSMMISGGLAGLAGVTQYAGNSSLIQIGVLPTEGFDGIAVALLGMNTPIGVFFSAIFFGILYSGKGFMSAMTAIPPEIADVIIAIIIYFAATSVLIKKVIDRVGKSRKYKNEAVNSKDGEKVK